MKMKAKRLSMVLALICVFTMMFGTLSVSAATVKDLKKYSATDAQKATAAGSISLTSTSGTVATVSQVITLMEGGTVAGFEHYDETTLNALRDTYLANLKAAGAIEVSDKVASDIDKIAETVDMKADIDGGGAWISDEAQELISDIIGFLTIIVLMSVGLFTALDIMFLEIPVFHGKLEELAISKGTTDKNGNPKPRFISRDACDAYKEAADNGKNVLLIYLKKRIAAYVAIAIVIYMLLSGNLSAIVKLVLNLISGALDSINGLA